MTLAVKSWLSKTALIVLLASFMLAPLMPQTVRAAESDDSGMGSNTCNQRFLTFPAWYRGLLDPNCEIVKPGSSKATLSSFIWTIVLNIIEFMLQLVGYIAVIFIIRGGFKYITSAGSSDGMVQARKTIINAVVGLVISIFSVAIVNVAAGAIQP